MLSFPAWQRTLFMVSKGHCNCVYFISVQDTRDPLTRSSSCPGSLRPCGAATSGFWRTNQVQQTSWKEATGAMILNSWKTIPVSIAIYYARRTNVTVFNFLNSALYQKPNFKSLIISAFKDFGSCLAKDIRSVEKDIGLVNENQEHLVQRKRRQELERTASIKTSCLMYKTGFSTGEVLDYLKNLSKITSRTLRGTNVDEEEV